MKKKRFGSYCLALQTCPSLLKTFTAMVFVAVAAAPGFAPAQSETRSSVNAVGFIKKTVAGQTLYQLHCPFTAIKGDANNTAQKMLGNLPNGSAIISWDAVTQGYVRRDVKLLGAWSPGTWPLFGQSCWLHIGKSESQDKFKIVLCGQIPDANSMPTSTLHLASADFPASEGNLNLVAFSYPVPISWAATAFAEQAGNGSAVMFYNSERNEFDTFTKDNNAWSGNFTLQPGQAFWLRAVSCKTWAEPKPYEWP